MSNDGWWDDYGTQHHSRPPNAWLSAVLVLAVVAGVFLAAGTLLRAWGL